MKRSHIVRFSALAVLAASAIVGCNSSNSAPVQPIAGGGGTAKPTTAPTATPTPKATAKATATPTPAPTPTPTPTAVAVSGAQAAAILTLGGSTYAFVPGLIASPAADANTVGLAEVLIANGTTLVTSHIAPKHVAHTPPNRQIATPRAASSASYARFGKARRFDTGAGGSQILPLSPAPQECAADVANTDLYCINYSSAVINVVHVDPATKAMTLVATYTTDATGSVEFSGGSATIAGLTYDSKDKGILIATPTNYELYSSARSATPNTKIRTVATINPAENFGYNPVTNQIWSPSYLPEGEGPLDANLIDVASGAVYNQSPLPTGFSEPDHGAIDSSTNIAVSSEEFTYTLYLVPLSQNVLGTGTFTNAGASTQTLSTNQENGCCPVSDISVDSRSHLLFSTVEFGEGIGVVQLPSTNTGTPAVGDYTFAALPPTASGDELELPGDPHAVATFNLGGNGPYGLTFDYSYQTVIVSDMRATLSAARMSGDAHGTTLTLGTNVFYDTI